MQYLHRVIALDDVLQAAAVARADDEQIGVLEPGHMTQGMGGRHAGADLNDCLGRQLVAHRTQIAFELGVLAGVGGRKRQRRVVVDADDQQLGPAGGRDRVREGHRAAAALTAVASGDDRAEHGASLGR